MPDWSRRSLLTAAGIAGVGSLAGCTAFESLDDEPQLSYTLTVEDRGERLLDTVGWSPDDGTPGDRTVDPASAVGRST